MGWLLILGFIAIALLILWRVVKIERQVLEIIAGGLLLAVAGYAWLGSPNLPGSPRRSVAGEPIGEAPPPYRVSEMASVDFLQSVDDLIGARRTREATDKIRAQIVKEPTNPDLRVALGQALFAHGDNHMNAAAEMAFQQAAEIAPNHPGPPFFFGFAQAQAGNYDEAASIWRALLARAPADAPWKADLESRLAEISALTVDPTAPAAQKAN